MDNPFQQKLSSRCALRVGIGLVSLAIFAGFQALKLTSGSTKVEASSPRK